MPVRITKLRDNAYRVSTPGGVKAKHTSRKRALALKRLLIGLDKGWKPSR